MAYQLQGGHTIIDGKKRKEINQLLAKYSPLEAEPGEKISPVGMCPNCGSKDNINDEIETYFDVPWLHMHWECGNTIECGTTWTDQFALTYRSTQHPRHTGDTMTDTTSRNRREDRLTEYSRERLDGMIDRISESRNPDQIAHILRYEVKNLVHDYDLPDEAE